jgi:ribosomal protein S18 acetylase RimI-like enzyme
MGLTYFKRFRMEFNLQAELPPEPAIAAGYELIPWSDDLIAAHAEAKYKSFRYELDANVFPCLGTREGCRQLMHEIAQRSGFIEEATWLLQYWPAQGAKPDLCGTIQGLHDLTLDQAAIQNIGVAPEHRGKGLGSVLMLRALAAFQKYGLKKCYLEVTAQNFGAVRLYQKLGFKKLKIVYKAAEVAYA